MAIFKLLLKNSISLMTVFLFGSAGEIITEKSGHLNLGIPGIVALGGLGGVVGGCTYINSIALDAQPNAFLCVFIPILFAIMFGAVGGLIFSFFSVTLRANQNVVGLCLTTLGVGITTFFLTNSQILNMNRLYVVGEFFKSCFPKEVRSSLNPVVDVLFGQGILTYIAIVLVLVCGFVLARTKVGLSIRAIGENPAAADSIGINVTKYRYITTIVGAMIAALGGLYLIMDHGGGVDPAGMDMESYGWLAVALVIFSMWKPSLAILGSFVFSILATLPNVLDIKTASIKHIVEMLPYIMTIVVLIITSAFKFKNNKAPAALGQSYFREDR